MLDSQNVKKIKEIVEEFFSRMTITARVDLKTDESILKEDFLKEENQKDDRQLIEFSIKVDDPQVLIGERGQTLNEIQRMLKMIIGKVVKEPFYLNIDINEYKKKKEEYLKSLAKDLADEVTLTKETKTLLPMPPYERRIIHAALTNRTDVITESEGEEPERKVVIKPK